MGKPERLQGAGEIYNIDWTGGDGSDVELKLLRSGDSYSYNVLSIFKGPATPSNFKWMVPEDILDASDYILSILQGGAQDYSAYFSITGGVSTSSTLSTSISKTSASSTNSASQTPKTIIAVTSTLVEDIESRTPSVVTITAILSSPASDGTQSLSRNRITTSISSIETAPGSKSSESNSLGPGPIAGIAIGSVCALALILIATLVLRRRSSNVTDTRELRPRDSTMSELSAGHKANRHEGSESQFGERLEKDGRAVRLSSTALHEMPADAAGSANQ